MSDSEYCKMLEMPINTCDVVIKPNKRKRKEVVKEVIEKVNEEIQPKEVVIKKSKFNFIKNFLNKNAERVKKIKKEKRVKKQNKVESSPQEKPLNKKFDIVSVQVVAIFVLVVGILLTNIFWEDSGMNNMLRSVFGKNEITNDLGYSAFSANAPSKTQMVSVSGGVMTIPNGSVYSPCDGKVESLSQNGDTFVMTVRHSNSFTSVFQGLEFCYVNEGENVFASIPLGYSSSQIKVSMYDNNLLLTNYHITGDNIVWLN